MEIDTKVSKVESKEKEGMDKFEIDNMVRTLIEAEEIKSDKEKMSAVKDSLAKKASMIHSIQGLRDKRKQLQAEAQAEGESQKSEKKDDA